MINNSVSQVVITKSANEHISKCLVERLERPLVMYEET